MISMIEGKDESQKVAMANARAMAMAMMRMVRMVGKLDDVTIGLDRLLCFLDHLVKLARCKNRIRRTIAKGRQGNCMTQRIFSFNGRFKGVAFILQQTDFVDGTQGLGRLALMFQEGQDMASEDSLLFVDRHGGDVLWWWKLLGGFLGRSLLPFLYLHFSKGQAIRPEGDSLLCLDRLGKICLGGISQAEEHN